MTWLFFRRWMLRANWLMLVFGIIVYTGGDQQLGVKTMVLALVSMKCLEISDD